MNIRVDAYAMTPSLLTVGTAGSYGIPKLTFSFSEDWDGLHKKVSFYTDSAGYVLLLEDTDTISVPSEIMANAGEYAFTVSGLNGTDTLITLAGKLTVLPTKEPAVTPPESPTPTEMAQIYDMLEDAVEAANGAVNAIQGAREAETLARTAAEQASRAESRATIATLRAMNAASSVVSVSDAEINTDGHLIVTLSNGTLLDAGSARGAAVTGNYVGNGSESQGIVLGFRPALLLLAILDENGCAITDPMGIVVCGDGLSDSGTPLVTMQEDGFQVTQANSVYSVNEKDVSYHYIAFADDCSVLGKRLDLKADKPTVFEEGHLAALDRSGNLKSSGKYLFDLAPSLKITTEAATEHSITDSIGGSFSSAIFYGITKQDGTPAMNAPIFEQSVSKPLVTLSSGSGNVSVGLGSLTLRGIEVRKKDDWNLRLMVDGAYRYYISDSFNAGSSLTGGTVTRRVGVYIVSGNETLRQTASGNYFFRITNAAAMAYNPCLCSHLPTVPTYSDASLAAGSDCGAMGNTLPYFYLKSSNYSSPTFLKAFLAGQFQLGKPMKIWYLLDKPTEETYFCPDLLALPLPATAFTVQSDAPVSLCYGCDTESAIEERIAALRNELLLEIQTLQGKIGL